MLRTTTLALALVLAACDGADPAGLAIPPGAYHLATVDGRALPATVERTDSRCDSNLGADRMVEVRDGTLTVIDDEAVRLTIGRLLVCESNPSERLEAQAVAVGRVVAGEIALAGLPPLPTTVEADGAVMVVASGLGPSVEGRRLRFVPAKLAPDPTGVWEGTAVYELDTTYALSTAPEVIRRHRLYRRFDLTYVLSVREDSVVGTGRFVSYYERVTTDLATGEVRVTGGRDEPQADETFGLSGRVDGPALTLDWYGGGYLLNWMDHPLVLEGDVLRTGLRNHFEGSYYSTQSVDLALARR